MILGLDIVKCKSKVDTLNECRIILKVHNTFHLLGAHGFVRELLGVRGPQNT